MRPSRELLWTSKPVESEQPNGFRIQLLDQGYQSVQPINFWGKADGTFENTTLFSGKYKVLPIEGAFVQPDTQTVDIAGSTKVDFSVVPYLRISIPVVEKAANKVSVQYSLSRSVVTTKIAERKLLVSSSPTVNNTTNNRSIVTDLSQIADDKLLNVTFTDVLTDLQPGTYYVRVAARTSNALNRYNYLSTIQISIP